MTLVYVFRYKIVSMRDTMHNLNLLRDIQSCCVTTGDIVVVVYRIYGGANESMIPADTFFDLS